MSYADWLKKLPPAALQEQWGGGVLEAIGEVLDELLERAIAARKVFMPEEAVRMGAYDALALAGKERQLEHGYLESYAAYAARLRAAWDPLERMGSAKALLEQARIAGFDIGNMEIIQRSGRRMRLDGAGNLEINDYDPWTWSGEPHIAYAEFGIVFWAPQPAISWSAENGHSEMAAKLVRLAWRWRPAKADFKGIIVVNSGPVWGEMVWGSFAWGGSGSFIPPR